MPPPRRCGSPFRRSRSSCCRCSGAAASPSPRPPSSGSSARRSRSSTGGLIPFTPAISAVGLAAAFLLGNLRNAVEAWLGLAIVLGGTAIIVYNSPDHAPAELFFTPLLFGIGWLAGYALRERAEQAEEAEARAARAEREREAAARVAVAEERARIARELHDIVAHAVSVMVLQVGAVRHKLPDAARGGPRCAQGGRADRSHGARRDAPPPRRHAPRRRRRRARRPSRASTASTRCCRRSAAPGFQRSCTSTATPSRSRARSICPRIESSRRA